MKQLGVTLDTALHTQAKIKAIKQGMTLSEYISMLIRKDIETKKQKE